MNKMKNSQAGFTLIELVMVIVILGILAATALPKFVDLSGDAYAAAAQGYAGALNSANSINYATCKAGNSACKTVAKCSDLETLINPAVTFVTPVASPAAKGILYLGTDAAASSTGTTCTGTYGDGSTGKTFTFTATAT